MLFRPMFISLLALALALPIRSDEPPLELTDFEYNILLSNLARIFDVADEYPPTLRSDSERREIEKLWQGVERHLLALTRRAPKNAALRTTLGDLYRMGYNLDVPDSGTRAVSALLAAIALDPSASRPHRLLGRYYTGSFQLEAGARELQAALLLEGSSPDLDTLSTLAMNQSLQKNWQTAIEYADRYLQREPRNPRMQALREAWQQALVGARIPQTYQIDLEGPPEGPGPARLIGPMPTPTPSR